MLNKIIAVLAAITISVVGVPLSALANTETSQISGNNSNIITKRYADYQKADRTENEIHLSAGINLAQTVTGSEESTPFVLIHGFTYGHVSWSQAAPTLTFKGYRVYAPKHRGNGKTDKPYGNERAYSVKELIKDIAEFQTN